MSETAATTEVQKRSLLHRIGGDQALLAFSGRLYEHILADNELAGHFAHTDMDDQPSKFARGLRPLMADRHDGPAPESMANGDPLNSAEDAVALITDAHRERVISDEHKTRVAVYAGVVLGELGVQQPELGELTGLVAAGMSLVGQRDYL